MLPSFILFSKGAGQACFRNALPTPCFSEIYRPPLANFHR